MNVWIQVSTKIQSTDSSVDLTSGQNTLTAGTALFASIYFSEEAAREAMKQQDGIVLEVTAESLAKVPWRKLQKFALLKETDAKLSELENALGFALHQ